MRATGLADMGRLEGEKSRRTVATYVAVKGISSPCGKRAPFVLVPLFFLVYLGERYAFGNKNSVLLLVGSTDLVSWSFTYGQAMRYRLLLGPPQLVFFFFFFFVHYSEYGRWPHGSAGQGAIHRVQLCAPLFSWIRTQAKQALALIWDDFGGIATTAVGVFTRIGLRSLGEGAGANRRAPVLLRMV